MSRRKSSGDQEFGSDSFLDIIANIVGILIILIVVAGMKVARQPALLSDIASTLQPMAEIAQPETDWSTTADSSPPPVDQIEVMRDPAAQNNPFAADFSTELRSEPDSDAASLNAALEAMTEPDFNSVASDDSSDEQRLNDQIDTLTLQLDEERSRIVASERQLQQLEIDLQNLDAYSQLAKARSESIEEEQQRLDQRVVQLQIELTSNDDTASSMQATLTSLTERQRYVSNALDQVSVETLKLSEALEESQAVAPGGLRLNHRLSPVSRSVQEGELHFRMNGGRIAHIPLEALLERLRSQVSARRNVVAKFHRYEGMVGPEGGFNMQYTVQRDSVAPLQALQQGQSGYRISVSRWSILPAETLAAERIDAAVRVGSRFRQILEATEPDTVVTIWLYPDDFQYFHQVRELAHRLNLRVAARPLPEGVDISGSPNGSRSSSQ